MLNTFLQIFLPPSNQFQLTKPKIAQGSEPEPKIMNDEFSSE